jgi:hypothetical protein
MGKPPTGPVDNLAAYRKNRLTTVQSCAFTRKIIIQHGEHWLEFPGTSCLSPAAQTKIESLLSTQPATSTSVKYFVSNCLVLFNDNWLSTVLGSFPPSSK